MVLMSIGGTAVSDLSPGDAKKIVRTKLLQYNREVVEFMQKGCLAEISL